MSQDDKLTPSPSDDFTIPSRKRRLDDVTHFISESAPGASSAPEAPPKVAPWVLQHYFDGEIDLIKEMVGRFPQLSVMSLITLREVGVKNKRGVASMSTQDGAAGLIAEVDGRSRAVQFTFVLSSM